MVISKSPREIALMKEAGRVVGLVFKTLEEKIRPGMTTLEIDEISRVDLIVTIFTF